MINPRIILLQLMFILTGLFLVIAPYLGPHFQVFDVDAQRVTQIILLLILCFVVIIFHQDFTWQPSRALLLGCTALTILAALSIGYSARPRFARLEMATFVALILQAWVFGKIYENRPTFFINTLKIMIVATTIAYLPEFFIRYLQALAEGGAYDVPLFLFHGYSNVRFFNDVLVILIPLFPIVFVNKPLPQLVRFGLYILLGILISFIFISNARAATLALLIPVVGVALLFRQAARIWLKTMLIGSILGVSFYLLLMYVIPAWQGHPDMFMPTRGLLRTDNNSDRTWLWHAAWVAIQHYPWLGVGPMHFSQTKYGIGGHPHNIYLQIAGEFGVPFLLVLLSILTRAFFKMGIAISRCAQQKQPTDLSIAATVATISLLIDGFAAGAISYPVAQTWFTIAAAIAVVWYKQQHNTTQQATGCSPAWQMAWPLLRPGLIACMALFGLIGIFMGVTPEVYYLEQYLDHQCNLLQTCVNLRSPRWWSVGQF